MPKIKVLELFAGIGACSKALERLGIEHEIVDCVEIDKYAVKSFNAVHGTDFEPQDITKWDKDIECDLVMHGSPCQDFSVAGKGAGGDEGSGTRSSLLYETLRIVDKLRPKYVIWENVKNLLSKKHVHNWDAYAERMREMGYTNYCQVLNAKNYGVPQNRERVFTVSILGDSNFSFPEPFKLEKKLENMLDDEVDEKFYLTESNIKTINRNFGSKGKILDLDGFSVVEKMTYPSRINQKKGETICPTLVSAMGTGGGNVPVIVASRGRNPDNPSDRTPGAPTVQRLEPRFDGCTNTLTSVQKDNYVAKNGSLRKLTPKECWRLMGFDDEDFEKAEKVNSNTQLYKQAGNSIVVNVLEAILNNLLGDVR